jgi:hypothetical protein
LGLSISTVLIAREQSNTKIAYELEREKAIEADQQRARAEKLGRQARQAVEYFSRIASDGMDRPEMAEVRRAMLEESLSYYEGLLADRTSPSVGAELDAARAHTLSMLATFTALDASLRSTTRVRLLSEESVQADLGVTGAQVAPLLQLVNDWGPGGNHSGGGPFESGQLSAEQRREHFVARSNELDQAVDRTLGPEKSERLRQIQRQLRGPLALGDSDVIERLGLTNEQREKIRNIQTQYRNSRMIGGPGSDAETSQKLRASAVSSITQLLTPDQLQSWSGLMGKPFSGTVNIGGPDDGPFGHGFGGPDHGHGRGPNDLHDDDGPHGPPMD